MDTLEQFVVIMHNRSSTTCKVDETVAIPTTQSALSALKAHVKRALFQVEPNVWIQSNVTEQQLSSPLNWGLSKQTTV